MPSPGYAAAHPAPELQEARRAIAQLEQQLIAVSHSAQLALACKEGIIAGKAEELRQATETLKVAQTRPRAVSPRSQGAPAKKPAVDGADAAFGDATQSDAGGGSVALGGESSQRSEVEALSQQQAEAIRTGELKDAHSLADPGSPRR